MRKVLASVAGAAVLFAAGCRTPKEPTHFELAQKAEQAGDKTTALKEYEEAVRLTPDHKYAWLHIGYLKSEKQGGKEYTRQVRDALRTFLLLETFETGNVAGDPEMEIPNSPEEPHLARRMVRHLSAVVRTIDQIEDMAWVIESIWRETPDDAELKGLAIEGWQAALDANVGESPKCHWHLGEVKRLSGDEAGARGHFEQAQAQAMAMGYSFRKAQVGLALTGGDLDAGWVAVQEENSGDLYVAYAEASLKKGDVDRAVAALIEGRRHHVDIRIWRLLAESQLLAGQTSNASSTIATLEMWPRRDKAVEAYLRLVWAALAKEKTEAHEKKFNETAKAGWGSFDPARLAAHVAGSDASGDAKAAVKRAAGK